jgi:magnesium-protoporphyrin IX monomethyl ester (oxidative) cyclase
LWDANFLTDVKRIEKLCDLLIERELTNFKICLETGVNDIIRAEKIMPKLRGIGVTHVGLGIESPNQETLKSMNKKINKDSCFRAVKILKEHNIKVQGFFIIGHYNETEEDTRKYPEYAHSLGVREALFMVMTPYPGTQIFNEYKVESKIKSFNWDLYNNFGTAVETKSMDIKTLKKLHVYCWGNFYVKFAFFNNSTPLGVVAHIIRKMAMFYSFLNLDPTNSRDEIKNYLLTYLESSCGEYNRETPRKNSFLLKTYKKFTMRFIKSPDESIDLQIVPCQDTYKLFIERPEKGTKPAGFVLDFETIIKLGERLTNNKLVAIASKFEIANSYKSLPERRFRKNLGLAFDQDILVTSANLVRYLFPVIIKGLLTMSLQAMKPKEQMPEKTGTG